MNSVNVAILGAGLSGMAAAKTLSDLNCTVYEARSHAGGHASSFHVDGFTFDEGPHLSFTPFERIKNFMAKSVDQRFFEHPAYATNDYQGHILKHPAQCNMYGLPPELITRCIADFVRAQYEPERHRKDYKDWCYRCFGETFSEVFTRPYTRKYWNLELEQLTTDWVSERIYAPKLEEVLEGALTKKTADHYYMSTFRYPEEGGFGSYSNLLQRGTPIKYDMRAQEIDVSAKRISFANGKSEYYDHLVSSLPLPEIIGICKDVPPQVREAADRLACTSHYIVSVGVSRPVLSEAYWTYYYDENLPFSRISFPYKYSANTARSGTSTFQMEVVHSRFKALPSVEGLLDQCIDGAIKVGVLHSRSEIIAVDGRDLRYSNVIFDFERAPNRAIVHDFLRDRGIYWCGRYGEWAYLWTDQSILSGERAGADLRVALGLESRSFDEAI